MEVFSSSIVINEDIIHFLIERKENWLDIFKEIPSRRRVSEVKNNILILTSISGLHACL